VRILSLDAGSSSLKYAAYDVAEGAFAPLIAGQREAPHDADGALDAIAREFEGCSAAPPAAVGHRIVFGGPAYVEPTHASDEVLQDLERLVPLDPLHLRSQIDLVHAVRQRFPGVPQVLCFDTAFHRLMPAVAKRLPLPRALGAEVQRYGFHGLSYEYVLWKLGEAARGRVIVAHLGSGASLCAARHGVPEDTTMGFSPLGGLMMSTRPGDLDPGVLLYLLGPGGQSLHDLTELLTHHSGLLAVSASSASMKTLLESSATDTSAREAVDLFVYQLTKHLGAMVAVLGGLDTLVFTAGIGERAPQVRARACAALGYLGLRLDEDANARNDGVISAAGSAVTVRVVPTDENLMVARHTAAALS